MQTPEERVIRFTSQEETEFELSLVARRYGAIYHYDKNFYSNKTVLDAGCGFGGGTVFITRNDPKLVIGVDASEKNIALAREKYSNSKTEYINALLWETQFADECFDIVTSVECIEHNDFEERDLGLKEFHRVLRTGGFLMITTPNKRTHLTFPSGSHFMEYTYDELQQIVTPFGFEFVWGNPAIGSDSMVLLFRKV
jgi:2-polyprenyl-3-methyl-5-hydroxy-6-metoxy-1,4-benzoquinol methylase